MRELIQANDPSYELSVQLALDAAGIKTVCEPRVYLGSRVLLVHDDDFARASRIVQSLQGTPVDYLPDTPGMGRARIIAGSVMGMLFAYEMWRILHGP